MENKLTYSLPPLPNDSQYCVVWFSDNVYHACVFQLNSNSLSIDSNNFIDNNGFNYTVYSFLNGSWLPQVNDRDNYDIRDFDIDTSVLIYTNIDILYSDGSVFRKASPKDSVFLNQGITVIDSTISSNSLANQVISPISYIVPVCLALFILCTSFRKGISFIVEKIRGV